MFSKVFERLVLNSLFNFFFQNKLFTPCQSSFIPGDSCLAQLLSITYEILKSFTCHAPTDMSGTFLDTFFLFFLFFYQVFLSQTLTTHRTAEEGRGPFFVPLYHFRPLTRYPPLQFNSKDTVAVYILDTVNLTLQYF